MSADKSESTTQRRSELNGYICICRDCDWTDATVAESEEELKMSGDDPAEQHYHETGHGTGSFPAKEFDSDQLWNMVTKDE